VGRGLVSDGRSLVGVAVGWCVAGSGVEFLSAAGVSSLSRESAGVSAASVSSLVSSIEPSASVATSVAASAVLEWRLVLVNDIGWARHIYMTTVTAAIAAPVAAPVAPAASAAATELRCQQCTSSEGSSPKKAASASPKKAKAAKKEKKAKKASGEKKPLKGFFKFSGEHRDAVKKAHPTWGVTDIAKDLGKQWKKLTVAEKAKY